MLIICHKIWEHTSQCWYMVIIGYLYCNYTQELNIFQVSHIIKMAPGNTPDVFSDVVHGTTHSRKPSRGTLDSHVIHAVHRYQKSSPKNPDFHQPQVEILVNSGKFISKNPGKGELT